MNLPLAILLACSPRLGAAEPLETLVGRTQADGAPLAARTEAVRLMRGMLGEADPDVVRRLVSNGAYVVVVPEGIRMTSRPEFARFAGLLTFDGRPWNEVRGIGYAPTPRGLAMGVGAENLLGRGVYAPGHTFVHEFAHLLEVSGLAPDMRRRVEEAYRVTPLRDETALGPYANKNASEAFAEATAAYFSVPHKGPVDAEDLRRRNPELHELMRAVYGSPRALGIHL